MPDLHRLPVARKVVRTTVAAAVASIGFVVLTPAPAFAATTLTVSTAADVPSTAGACGDSSIVTAPAPLSLREAVCLANNIGGTVTISIPAGSYTLTNGELQPGTAPGQNVTLAGAGASNTVIDAGGLSRVLDFDQGQVGGIGATVSGLTITGGADSTFGGAGIIGGSGNAGTGDTLVIADSVITGNHANALATGVTNNPGGGVQFLGGNLTISNSTISGNTSANSAGPGVAYGALGVAAGEGLTITSSTFSSNSAQSSAGVNNGGALALSSAVPGVAMTVTGSTFTGNTVTSSPGSAGLGGGIWSQSGTLTVTGSTFTGNSVTGAGTDSGGAVAVDGGTATLHYNRIVGNTAASGSGLFTGGTATGTATENWWGCSTGPGTTGCDTASGPATVSPRLTLTAAAVPATVVGPNATSTVTASLLTDSANAAVAAPNLGAFAGLTVQWSDPQPANATLSPATSPLANGQATTSYSSNLAAGVGHVVATLDNSSATAVITVDRPPAITSADTATFKVSVAGSFTITTTGYPSAAISETGAVPAGLTLTDNGNGTATLTGTPAVGSGGSTTIAVTAGNGVSPAASQTLTIVVDEAPSFTSAASTVMTVGTAGSFAITTGGFPTVATVSKTGALPPGVSFTDNGNGTATLAGTPAAGSGGDYPLTLTAGNGVTPDATQNLVLTVREAPGITAQPAGQTVTPGSSVSFLAAASGFPAPTAQWQVSTDGGVSFTDIGGATSPTFTFTATLADSGHRFRAVFSNVVSSATTNAATLTVGTAPAFTSADHTTFAVGAAGSFGVTVSGIPNATITATPLPSWLLLTDNGNGTATLAGTPPVGSGRSYTFTMQAANGIAPAATQTFTLIVTEAPSISSPNHAAFVVGTAGTFTVTTVAGFPISTTITEAGALPPGVSFNDNGNGTGTLFGTPGANTGGSYPLTFTAGNGAGAVAQSFTLTVGQPPAVTSVDHATFTAGTAGTFTVTTTGFPTAAISQTGALPAGVTLTDNHDGTATIAGTAASGGVFAVTVSAANGVAPDAAQAFTLTVDGPPSITSASSATFIAGVHSSFTVTTMPGVPAATTITESGPLPAGVTFTDNHDGTATIAGLVKVKNVGSYPITLTAANGIAPDAGQSFTLVVVKAKKPKLPAQLPASSGTLNGVPASCMVGQVLHLGGSGFAAGAPITVGIYSSPAVLVETLADNSGNLTVAVTVPDMLGHHTFVAAGTAPDGTTRYLEAATVISAAASPTTPAPQSTPTAGSTTGEQTSGGGALATTGPRLPPVGVSWLGLRLLIGGGLLVLLARRPRRG